VSLAMLAAANRRARRASLRGRPRPLLVAADAHRPVFRSAFDLILAPGDPLSHMKTIEGRKKTLRAIARQLAPEGVFVLEGLYRQRREVVSPRRMIVYAGGVLYVEETWTPVGSGHLWRARYRYVDDPRRGPSRTLTATFLAKAWNPATIRAVFRSCGLETVELWGDFDRRPLRAASPRILVVARRLRGAATSLP
jgi:hypothetical protein